MAGLSIFLSQAAAELAKSIRMVNFFRGSRRSDEVDIAFLKGKIRALRDYKVISHSEHFYLLNLIKAGTNVLPEFEIENWEACIARPGYYPYENSLEELAKKEMNGAPMSSLDGRPDGAYPCSPSGISFHKFEYYSDHIEVCEMKRPLDPLEKTMKLVSIDKETGPEWYAAEIAIAITVAFIRRQRDPAVLGFTCEKGDLLAEHVLEGAQRAKRFDEDFPATWNEKEHDYRLMHSGDAFLLDYHWLVVVNDGNEEIVRKPLLDPLDMD